MPEGPEITLMVDKLSKIFKNSKLKQIYINHDKFKSKIKNFKNFENELPSKIIEIKNKGKFVYINLLNDWSLGFTPGMTGHFWIPDISKNFKTFEGYVYNSKHDHIILEINKGEFYFNDPRRFGHFYI